MRSSSRRALAAGAFVCAAYLIGAAVSGRLSPLARLPLLDGVHTQQPYRWVTPPPDQAATNQQPATASQRLPLGPKGNSAKVLTTTDQQASLSLPAEAVAPAAGRRSAEIKIEPLDPAAIGATPPEGFEFSGNVYRVVVRYVPGGAGVGQLDPAGTMTLVYPPISPTLLGKTPITAFSADGKSFLKIDSTPQHATQQVSSAATDAGYFAVAFPRAEAAKKKGKGFPWVVLVVIVAAVGLVSGIAYRIVRVRRERRAKAERRAALIRQSRSTKKRRR